MTTPGASRQRPISHSLVILLLMTSSLCPVVWCSKTTRSHRNYATSGSAFDNDDALTQPASAFHRLIRVSSSSSSNSIDDVDQHSQPKKFRVVPINKGNTIVQGQQMLSGASRDSSFGRQRAVLSSVTQLGVVDNNLVRPNKPPIVTRSDPTAGSLIVRSMLKREFFAKDRKRQTYCCSMDMYCFTCTRR